MEKDNKKLPVDPWSDATIEPEYGYIKGYRNLLGGHHFTFYNPEAPEKASSQTLDATGSYETRQHDDSKKEIITKLQPGEVRDYTSGGTSTHNDGHTDTRGMSTDRQVVDGDQGLQVGRNKYASVAGTNIETARESAKNIGFGASESRNFEMSAGDEVSEHSGNKHVGYEKDYVISVKKNLIQMINEGDYAQHVQAGNWDTHVKQKVRFYADDDILIESATKITIKVGESYVILTPGRVDVIADGHSGPIHLNENG